MYLLIDIGNTRTKYGCHDGQRWRFQGVQTGEFLALPEGFKPRRILASCVAGPAREAALRETLSGLGVPVEFLRAEPQACGLACAYEDPATLGPDRWAAAIGAWQTLQGDCLVVSAGTATTIDLIRSPGRFEGGVILPGLSLMQTALAQGTAKLPLAEGQFRLPARNTRDAIHSGCLLAQIGAIREMARELPPKSPILLSGGNAERLLPHLGAAAQLRPWLVLEGLLALAGQPSRST